MPQVSRAVRRSVKVAPVVVDAPALDALKKAELVELAEQRGVDTSGTKADILGRLGPESNDATVRADD